MSKRQFDFNAVNKDLVALTSINDVDERFISSAGQKWWAYQIAAEFSISPVEIKKWDAEDVMEALAAIGIMQRNAPKNPQ